MSSLDISKSVRDFVDAIQDGNKRKSAYDTQATVLRIDGDTAWVHIPGGVDETPVRRTINANAGDRVQVRVAKGKAWITGNATNPPTDDTKANAADARAVKAIDVADQAWTEAESAHQAADTAWEWADSAHTAADEAWTWADEAHTQAERATGYANDSLAQLGVVEDVVGTLNWITTHATYKATADTEVRAGKWYFTKSGNTYNVVINPTGNPSTQGYYEIDTIDEAVSNYVASHLALTDAGLWVTKDGNGYKILLANDGMKVYDSGGHLVSTFGESIVFDSERPQTIGDSNAYIRFDGNGHITIGGTGVSIGSSVTIGALDDYSTTNEMNSAIGDAVDGIEVGGRNLLLWSDDLLHTNIIRVYSGSTFTKTKQTVSEWSTDNAVRVTGTGGTNTIACLLYGNQSVVAKNPMTQIIGTNYSASIYIKNHSSTKSISIRPNGSEGSVLVTLAPNETKKLTWSWTAGVASNVQFNISTESVGDAFDFSVWHPMWAEGTKVTDWTPAPEDIEASAVEITQRIYYRSNTATKPTAYPTAWVTEEGNKWNGNATTVSGWSRKVTPISDGNGKNVTKYLYLWTATQKRTVDGIVAPLTASDIALDDSTTVIDGGQIITGSILANKIDADNINASKLLTIGSFSTDTRSEVLNSEIEIGGRNFLQNTDFIGWTNCGSGTAGTFNNDVFMYPTTTADGWTEIRPNKNVKYDLVRNKTITLSAEVRATSGSVISVMMNPYVSTTATGNRAKFRNAHLSPTGGGGTSAATTTADGTWQKVYTTVDITDAFFTSGGDTVDFDTCYFGARCARVNTNHVSYQLRHVKIELGNKATDWTPAPEDVQAEIDAKKSVHTLMSSGTNGSPYASILAWSAEGRTNERWGIDTTATPLTNVKIGDTCRVAYKISDMGTADNKPYAYVIGEVTNISGSTVYMTMHGLDSTVIDGGNILTNSIGANQIKVNSITTNKLDANNINASKSLTIGAFTTDSQSQILNSNAENLLLDTDVPSLTAVNANYGRYFSDSGQSSYVTCSIVPISDPPEPNIKYAYKAVGNGTNTYVVSRALVFNNATNTTEIPFKVGTEYTVSYWGRRTSGTAKTFVNYRYKTTTNRNALGSVMTLTSEWKLYTGTIRLESMPTDYNRVWFYVQFPANTAGTAELCGFKITARASASTYITQIDDKGIFISPSNQSPTESAAGNSIKIDGTGMNIYKNGDSVAFYGENARIGKEGGDSFNVRNNELSLYAAGAGKNALKVSTSNVLQTGMRTIFQKYEKIEPSTTKSYTVSDLSSYANNTKFEVELQTSGMVLGSGDASINSSIRSAIKKIRFKKSTSSTANSVTLSMPFYESLSPSASPVNRNVTVKYTGSTNKIEIVAPAYTASIFAQSGLFFNTLDVETSTYVPSTEINGRCYLELDDYDDDDMDLFMLLTQDLEWNDVFDVKPDDD